MIRYASPAVEVGVFLIDGKLVAWHNECPHRHGPVCQGRLYKRVLEPLRRYFGKARHLIVSPDEALWRVPWAALPVDDETYLIEKYRISYSFAGRDLVENAWALCVPKSVSDEYAASQGYDVGGG